MPPEATPATGPARLAKAHFSGIGGVGMVGGARLALEAGWEVRGSDNPLYPPGSEMVEGLGVPVATGYAAENLDWAPDVVVMGNALSRGNAEVEAVLERRLRFVSLPEWVKETALRARRPIVICGTHGKTTTTALTAYLLRQGGLAPGYLIGGQAADFQHPAHLGASGAFFVIEGDEYDSAFFDKRAKFLHYLPEIAVVTSIEYDHGDIYSDVDEIERAFRLMLRQIPATGRLLICADDPRAAALRGHAFCPVATYGFAESADWRIADRGPHPTLLREGKPWVQLKTPLTGRHNLSNAAAAAAVAGMLAVEPQTVEAALTEFRGVKRRMEVFLQTGKVTCIDDFAHHPTAVRETIAAAQHHWRPRRLRVLLEPRSNTMVTNRFQRELEQALSGADEAWIGPPHRTERVPFELRLDRKRLAADLRERGVDAHAADDIEEMVSRLCDTAEDGDLVLILSNGAFGGIRKRLEDVFAAETG